MNSYNLLPILVPLLLAAGSVLVLLGDLAARRRAGVAQWIAAIVLLLAGAFTLGTWGQGGSGFFGQIWGDAFASFFNLIFLAAAFLVVLSGADYLTRNGIHLGEYYSLVLLAVLGMSFMASGGDLLIIFLGIETMSIALYVLAGFHRTRPRSNEAALKYLLLGAFSTGFLLYGIAMVYGQIGTTSLIEFSNYLASSEAPFGGYMGIGVALLLVGLAFKVAAVPFHFWSPDVYDGAPTPITALMSTASKAAAFAAVLRVFYLPDYPLSLSYENTLWVLAVLTMTVGNLSALAQTGIKRMLAYSSIAHAGYMLVGFVAMNELGAAGILYYLGVYLFMNVGAFTIAWLVNRRGGGEYQISDYAQLGYRRPTLAILMSVFLLSLIGIPPLAGFFGKLYVFSAAVQAGYVWLVVIAVLNSAVSVYYYLRVIVVMYMKEDEGLREVERAPSVAFTAAVCGILIILLGVFSGSLLDLARASVASLP
jgi:NADH-quinone oxidoreductase subunit N